MYLEAWGIFSVGSSQVSPRRGKCVHAKSLQSCSILSDPMHCCPPRLCPWDCQQEYWSGLPCPPPEDLPNPGIKPVSHVSCIGRLVLYHWCHLGSPTEYYLAIKRNKNLPFAATWIDVAGIMPDEIIRQRKTDAVWSHLYVEYKKYKKLRLLTLNHS